MIFGISFHQKYGALSWPYMASSLYLGLLLVPDRKILSSLSVRHKEEAEVEFHSIIPPTLPKISSSVTLLNPEVGVVPFVLWVRPCGDTARTPNYDITREREPYPKCGHFGAASSVYGII